MRQLKIPRRQPRLAERDEPSEPTAVISRAGGPELMRLSLTDRASRPALSSPLESRGQYHWPVALGHRRTGGSPSREPITFTGELD